MQKIIFTLWVVTCMSISALADNAFINLEYQNTDFDGSLQKTDGQTYAAHAGYRYSSSLYEAAFSKTHTKTIQPPMKEDMNVGKYYLKYTHMIDSNQAFSVNYATLVDNLAKETDGGNIYGVSYRYKNAKISQYLSDYSHFNVYQTDLGYTLKYKLETWKIVAKLRATYIHLQDRESNGYSAKAKENYFTPALMLRGTYDHWHIGAGAHFGKRIFAIMHDGLGVQNHAMEFDRTFMVAAGRTFGSYDLTLKYLYMRAKEVPIDNPNVEINKVILGLGYRF